MGVLDWSRSLVGAFDKFGDSLPVRNRPDISGHSPALRSDFFFFFFFLWGGWNSLSFCYSLPFMGAFHVSIVKCYMICK